MKTTHNFYLSMSLILCSMSALAADLTHDLKQCQEITDDHKRLQCYDQMAQAITSQVKTDSAAQSTDQPKHPIPSLLADLNEPNLYVSYGSLDFLGDDFNAFLFGAGIRQSVTSFEFENGNNLTFNIFGQIRSQFDVDELDTRNNRGGALINTDFSVGGELEQSLDHWSWRFSYVHKSTHLGDEFIIDNPNFLVDRLNLSYETIRWTAFKSIKNWDFYAGLGFITRAEPSGLDKGQWQLGWQYLGNRWGRIKPVWAVDLSSWGAYDWTINMNLRAGIEIHELTDTPFQLLFEYQDGHSPYGQFFTEDLTFAGITLLTQW